MHAASAKERGETAQRAVTASETRTYFAVGQGVEQLEPHPGAPLTCLDEYWSRWQCRNVNGCCWARHQP